MTFNVISIVVVGLALAMLGRSNGWAVDMDAIGAAILGICIFVVIISAKPKRTFDRWFGIALMVIAFLVLWGMLGNVIGLGGIW